MDALEVADNDRLRLIRVVKSRPRAFGSKDVRLSEDDSNVISRAGVNASYITDAVDDEISILGRALCISTLDVAIVSSHSGTM